MKPKLIFKTALFFLVVVLCGFSSKDGIPYIVNFSKRFVPVDKNLYADKYELTLKDYQLFLKEKQEAGADCSLLIYDSTLWRTRLTYNEPMVDFYFRHPAFRDYPIICISHHAANEFCKWLTEKYDANPKKKYKKVVFRLPTESEFIKAASSIYDPKSENYPWGSPYLLDCKNGQRCNYQRIREEYLNYNDSAKMLEYEYFKFRDCLYTVAVNSYQPNPYGLYNMVGNVSEMIQEEGIAMGGDWCSTGYNVRITSKKNYASSGSVTVGFRVYMEIIEF